MTAQPDLFGNSTSGAWFSPCRTYRYALWRGLEAHAEMRRPFIVAWGSIAHPLRAQQIERFVALAALVGAELACFGRTKDGSPLHPLTLSYERKLEAWTPEHAS